jgi:hypothetical protein
MPRPPRRRLSFDEDSVNKLLQEIYDETHNIKAKLNRLFTKWEQKVKEGGEIAAIGDQIVKLIAAEAKNQEQKIILLRYLKEVVFDNKAGGSPLASSGQKTNKEKSEEREVTTEERNNLLDFVQQEIERRQKENKE